jgi:hypothetical protein
MLIGLVAFQLGWLASVLGAAHGFTLIGMSVALLATAVNVVLAKRRGWEALSVLCIAALGFVVDTVLIALGVFTAASAASAWFAPLWLVVMWANFGATLNGLLRWMRGKQALQALFGFVGGPAAYWGGQALGAVRFDSTPLIELLVMGVAWGVVTPLSFEIARRVNPKG